VKVFAFNYSIPENDFHHKAAGKQFSVVYLRKQNQRLKFFISIFIIFTIALRPVLPLIDYAMNYKYIVENLCEKRDIPQSTCKGKCYLEKELSKTEKQSSNGQNLKLAGLDVFVSHDILSCSLIRSQIKNQKIKPEFTGFHTSEYHSRIFHPPLA